ncbi:hypothetical protein, partial [Bifidobacterium adolescentis]|uniref:hypothetical protein n=1 Tax=Bifidobacterium adolescentis TaxID=1680 RepID=UPI003B9CA041
LGLSGPERVARWYPPAPPRFGGMLRLRVGAVFGYCDFGKCRFSRILRFFETCDFRKSALRLYEG